MSILSRIYLGLPTSPVELLTNGDFELQTGDDFDDWTEVVVAGTEMLTNRDFELVVGDNFTDWTESETGTGTVEDEGVVVHGGSHSAKLVGPNFPTNFSSIRQNFTAVVGKAYTLRMWVKGEYDISLQIGTQYSGSEGTEASWTLKEERHIATATGGIGWFSAHDGTVYYDDISILEDFTEIVDTGTSHGGTHAVKITNSGYIHQTAVSDPGDKHRFSFWSKGDGSKGVAYQVYDVTNGVVIASGNGTTSTTYTETVETYYVPASCVSIKITFTGVDGAVVYLDDVTLLEYGSLNWTENTDILSVPAPSWGYGLGGKDPLRGVANTGTANFSIENDEGKYSPENTARITGFEEGMPIKITTAVDAEIEITDDLLLNGGFET